MPQRGLIFVKKINTNLLPQRGNILMTNATMQQRDCEIQRLYEALRSRPYEELVWVRDCVAKPRNDAKQMKQ